MILTKKNLLIFFVCFLVGLWSVLPSALFFLRAGDNFSGIWPQLNGDRLYYFSRIQEVIDGHREINHPYFYEHKEAVYPQATGAERIQAALTKLAGLSTASFQVILDFTMPFIIALLTYILFTVLGVRFSLALLAPSLLFTVVSGGLLKPIHPQITFVIFLLFLIFWVKSILTDRKVFFGSLAGVMLGLLFLTYFYHWSFLLVVLGVYGLICLIKKDRKLFLNHLLILALGILIGVPYFFLIKNGLASAFHAETMVRVGAYYSHFPETFPRLLVALVWLLFFLWFGKAATLFKRPAYLIILTLLIGNVIYPNHQIITGLIIQNANHWSFMPIILYTLAGFYIITQALSFKKLGAKFFVNFIIVLTCALVLVPAIRLMSFGFSGYIKTLKMSSEDLERQEYGAVFDWINSQHKDLSFFASKDLLSYIPAYTHANVYYTDYAFNLPGSDKEVIERALLSHFFESSFFEDQTFGMQIDSRILWVQPAQSERNTHKLHHAFGIKYDEQYSLSKEISKVSAIYEGLKRQGWNLSLLKKYKIDYFIWDKSENPLWALSKYSELQKVDEIGDFEVYEFVIKP